MRSTTRMSHVTRRQMLGRTASAGWLFGASSVVSPRFNAWADPVGANGMIRVGVIGTGVRGKYLIGNLPSSVRVVAICDCAASRMAEALKPRPNFAEVLHQFVTGDAGRCRTYQDYRRMLDTEQLDAVIIATPDHHHVQAAMMALLAGLDVYLEKPLSVTIREGRALSETVRQTGRVLQVGSQQRTMEVNRFVCEFIRDGGLGKISHVDFPNYPGPIADPQFPAEPAPKGLDWDLFLGPAKWRAHNRKLWIKDEFNVGGLLWRGWDLFQDYSGHLMTNWGAHSIDMVQYALGMDGSGPTEIRLNETFSEAALERDWVNKWSKKTPRPNEPWANASRFHPVSMRYPTGAELRLLPGIDTATFYGELGRIKISRNRFEADPVELLKDGPGDDIAERWNGAGHVARPHLENWIECLETRGTPNAPIEVGHRSVTVCHLANLVRHLGRPLHWDPQVEQFVGDPAANEYLERPRRQGFDLPHS